MLTFNIAKNKPKNEENPENEDGNEENIPEKNITEKRRKNIFFEIAYDFSTCNFFLVDLNDILQLKPHGVELNYLYEFIKSIFDFKVQIAINFPNVIHNISMVSTDDIQLITDVLSLTDIFLFEKKEAQAFFTLQSHLVEGSSGLKPTKTEEKSLEILFVKEIKRKRKLFPKIGVFIEEFHHVTIIEQEIDTNLVLYHSDYDFNLFKNHNVVLNERYAPKEEIYESDEYKKVLLNNYSLLKSAFLGGFFSRYIHKKSYNTACQAGNELTKKVIDIIRYKLPYNDPKQFIVKIKKPKPAEKVDLLEEENKGREGRFVLDGCNIINSKMTAYNALYDDNLTTHFSSFSTRKYLKKVGFINRKGQILNDPDKNNIGFPKNKHLLKVFENQKKKLNIIKDNNDKMKLQINSLFQRKEKSLKNVSTANLHKFSKVNFNPITNKKLPTLEYAWEKHPQTKKCGSTLYAANITTNKKQNLKPISKELYTKLLNNFENKANFELDDRGEDFEGEPEVKVNSKTQDPQFYRKKDSLESINNNTKILKSNNNDYPSKVNNNSNKVNNNDLHSIKNNQNNNQKQNDNNNTNSKDNSNNSNEDNDKIEDKAEHENHIHDEVLEGDKNSDDLINNKVSSEKEDENKEISKEATIKSINEEN